MTDTISRFLDTLTILQDYSADSLYLIVGVLVIVMGCGFLFATIKLFVDRWLFHRAAVIIIISVLIILIFCSLYTGIVVIAFANKHPKNIQLLILSEDIDHTQIHKYFKVADAKIDNEVIITPRPEYYDEVLEWYNANYPIV